MLRPSLLQNLFRHRDLWWQFTVRAVEMKHRGSYLGIIWAVFNPLLSLALYVTVFGFIWNNHFNVLPHETTVDYALAVFVGLILFHLTADTLGTAPTYIVGNPNLVKKVVFPLEILPIANISALWFHFLISLALLFAATLILGRPLSLIGILWLPVILAPHIFLSIGLGWFLAALGTFFRDIMQVIGFLSQVMMWTSGVFFSPAALHQNAAVWAVLKWNPMLHTIDLTRRALLWDLPIQFNTLLYTWLAGLAVFIFGGWFFKKTQHAFADVL